MPGYAVKIIKGGSFLMASVGSELSSLYVEGVGQVFLNFADVKGGVHEAYPTPLAKWFHD